MSQYNYVYKNGFIYKNRFGLCAVACSNCLNFYFLIFLICNFKHCPLIFVRADKTVPFLFTLSAVIYPPQVILIEL